MKNEKNNIFWTFSGKYGKMQEKVKNHQKGSQIAEKKRKLMKNEENNDFWTFSGKYEKCRKR